MPDLSGKVVLVTGGNTGIGFEMIKSLLRKNAKVYLAARSQQKGEAAIRALKDETGKTAEFLPLDLNDLAAVRTSAQEFAKYADTVVLISFVPYHGRAHEPRRHPLNL